MAIAPIRRRGGSVLRSEGGQQLRSLDRVGLHDSPVSSWRRWNRETGGHQTRRLRRRPDEFYVPPLPDSLICKPQRPALACSAECSLADTGPRSWGQPPIYRSAILRSIQDVIDAAGVDLFPDMDRADKDRLGRQPERVLWSVSER